MGLCAHFVDRKTVSLDLYELSSHKPYLHWSIKGVSDEIKLILKKRYNFLVKNDIL